MRAANMNFSVQTADTTGQQSLDEVSFNLFSVLFYSFKILDFIANGCWYHVKETSSIIEQKLGWSKRVKARIRWVIH